jgi:formate dehydrogenase maturation protein FdhE
MPNPSSPSSKFGQAMDELTDLWSRHNDAMAYLDNGWMPRDPDYWVDLSQLTMHVAERARQLIMAGIEEEYTASTQQFNETAAAVLKHALGAATTTHQHEEDSNA